VSDAPTGDRSGPPDEVTSRPLHLRLAEAGDCDAFVQLYNATYRRKVDSRYFHWQFLDRRAQAFLILAESDGRIVGAHGGRVHAGRVLAGTVPLVQGLDVMVVDEFRSKGAYTQGMMPFFLQLARQRGAAMAYAVGNTRSWPLLTRVLGWNLVARIETMTREVSAQRSPRPALGFERVPFLEDEDSEILRRFRLCHPGLLVVGREPASLNWRFAASPVYRYDLFRVTRGSARFAYLVLKVFEDPATGERCGDIVDLLWIEDEPDALVEMLQFAMGHFHGQGVTRAAMWLRTNTVLDEIGRGLGFAETAEGRYLCCKGLDPEHRRLEEARSWYLTMADSEVY
jgi:hypothetical protein